MGIYLPVDLKFLKKREREKKKEIQLPNKVKNMWVGLESSSAVKHLP